MPPMDFEYSDMYVIQKKKKYNLEQILQQDSKTLDNSLHLIVNRYNVNGFVINIIKWLLWTVESLYFDAVEPVFYIYSN